MGFPLAIGALVGSSILGGFGALKQGAAESEAAKYNAAVSAQMLT